MERILECVPNFSEGKDESVIYQIVSALSRLPNVKVLHVDMGHDAHRTVITFAGEPEQVVKGAFEAISIAKKLIDMRRHKGAHPRMGAVDVCPLIPVKGVSMEEAIVYSKQLAEMVGEKLYIPVYLYAESQPLKFRRHLEHIRKGEYEGWPKKIMDVRWRPDYGPAMFDERFGGVVIGARPFLIAYNINLLTEDVAIAKRIAASIRGSGHIEDINGIKQMIPGRFLTVKAIGWHMPQFCCTQVSTNITDIDAAPLHVVFEAVKEEARMEGVEVNGSELVGLVPESALLAAGKFYNKAASDKQELVKAAIEGLGLNSVKKFDPKVNILEWNLEGKIRKEDLKI